MNATKKLSAGAWLSIVTCVLSLAALVAYLINTSAAGYFQNATVSNLVLMVVGALNSTVSRYCRIFRIRVVFCFRQSMTKRICSLFSFSSFDRTTSAG